MKVLVAAYCCAPSSGSEQAFGWWWVTTCARDHEVIVLTPRAQRAAIEACADPLPPTLRFEYVGGPSHVSASGSSNRFERVRQYLWALRVSARARAIVKQRRPDVAQQVTTGTWRVPSALMLCGIPFVQGPLAGSERIPRRLFVSLGPRGYVGEKLRAAQMRLARLDPLVRFSLRRAAVILAAGPATFEELSRRYPGKTRPSTRAFPHGRIDRREELRTDRRGDIVELCWVGRLVQGKGLELLLTALADPRLASCRLSVYGDGPDRRRYEDRASKLGVSDRVVFHGHVDQEVAFEAIRSCDVFVFTSLRDLMGQALSEAMQLGAACVILDWSGPAQLAGPDAALKVPVSDVPGTIAAIADAVARAADDPSLRAQLRRAARGRIDELVDGDRSAAMRDQVFRDAMASARPRR